MNNVEVRYSQVILVLKGVSLEVGDGKISSLLGANGAGKTTTLKAISGLLSTELGKVTEGSVEFNGIRIDRKDAEEIVRLGIVQVMEGRKIFEHLSVNENLLVGAYSRGNDRSVKKDLDLVFSYFPRLEGIRKRVSGYLSGGEQQMLLVGRAVMAKPKLILLDEPSLGLAPILVKEIFEIVKKFGIEQKVSVLLVEQNASAALNVAEHAYVMENGRIVLDGPSSQLKENVDIREFYLGLTEVGKKKSYRTVKHYKRRKRWLG